MQNEKQENTNQANAASAAPEAPNNAPPQAGTNAQIPGLNPPPMPGMPPQAPGINPLDPGNANQAPAGNTEESLSLFGALGKAKDLLFSKGADSDGPKLKASDLTYADVVEAALQRKPSKQARILSIATALFIFIFICWAAWAEVDEVTRAEGKVIASQRTQIIQNLEGGILQEIMVGEGQTITKGTPLARIDNEVAASTYRDAVSKSLENEAAIIRLEAELTSTEPVFPESIIRTAPQIISDQNSIMNARKLQRDSEILLLKSQYEQRLQEVEEQQARKRSVDRSLALSIEQRNTVLPLLKRNNYSRIEFLNLEQEVANLEGELDGLTVSIPKAQSAADEALQRITFREAELDAAITEEINERRAELNSLRETIAAGGDRVTRTVVRSPVNGIIKQIHLNTIGGVVKPGEAIMEVVPLDDTLLVEVRVRPSDVAFLHPDQKAVLKFSAYDFGVYGGLDGVLEQISADTIEDKQGEVFYLAKLRTHKTGIAYRGETLPIIPGMTATADILTGRKTILDYILKPILKAQQNALRER